jgi:hypothetical protein
MDGNIGGAALGADELTTRHVAGNKYRSVHIVPLGDDGCAASIPPLLKDFNVQDWKVSVPCGLPHREVVVFLSQF